LSGRVKVIARKARCGSVPHTLPANRNVGRDDMRLNRNLGIVLLLLAPGILSASTARQLMDVGVASKDNATTLTIRANGTFQHTEYRPTDNLLLVDLSGVSAAKLENHGQDFHGKFPGVSSYHVVGYKGANGSSITRVEMALAPDAI